MNGGSCNKLVKSEKKKKFYPFSLVCLFFHEKVLASPIFVILGYICKGLIQMTCRSSTIGKHTVQLLSEPVSHSKYFLFS